LTEVHGRIDAHASARGRVVALLKVIPASELVREIGLCV
jgi:hypothetical protein